MGRSEPIPSQDKMATDQHVDLGMLCLTVCTVLKRGTDGKKLDDLNKPACDAINRLEE